MEDTESTGSPEEVKSHDYDWMKSSVGRGTLGSGMQPQHLH